MSTSPQPQSGALDPMMDSMLDLSDYDNYQSPSLSPANSKAAFPRPAASTATTPSSLLSTSQPLSGPSHQYDLYKQQTGIVPGALASTLAVNQNNSQITGYSDFNLGFMGMNSTDDLFDFNTAPSQSSIKADTDMDFDSPSSDPNFFFGDSTVNPSSIGGQEPSSFTTSPVIPMSTSNVGRLYPGMHSQAALAKAQAQQRQQQQVIQQRQNAHQQQAKPERPKAAQPTDPIVEQKIAQLLNTMRNKAVSDDGEGDSPVHSHQRMKKDEDDMDEDEKLLASEEGKKLSSKERRQLRNKVSARAFRSRRKGK
jgi:bZIP-type transcription factor MBZ1